MAIWGFIQAVYRMPFRVEEIERRLANMERDHHEHRVMRIVCPYMREVLAREKELPER